MESLKQEDRLLAAPGIDVSAYDPAIMDPDHTYFSTKLITTGIVYNTGAPMKPQSWKDLLKPEAKDKIAMPSPLTSGAATIHMVALTGNPELGWDYYRGLAEQGANPQGGNGGVYKAVAGGEKLLSYDFPRLPRQKGATARHAIYGGQWRGSDREKLGRLWRRAVVGSPPSSSSVLNGYPGSRPG
jgi:iron(III) transport system substrate-binding protein